MSPLGPAEMTDSKTDGDGVLFVTADSEDPRFNQPPRDEKRLRWLRDVLKSRAAAIANLPNFRGDGRGSGDAIEDFKHFIHG